MNSQKNLPFRAASLLFLMLCLMISCPVKRGLKSIFFADAPLTNPASTFEYPKRITNNHGETNFEKACTKTVQSLLNEIEINPIFQNFSFHNPFLFLAFTLASLFLLFAGTGTSSRQLNAFSGDSFASKTPLFLRHRQLLI